MKKRFSLLLAIVMVIAMVLPMLPMLSVPTVAAEAAVADDVIATITGSDGTVKHTMTSGKFEDFSAKAVDGDTVTLYKDITTTGNSWFYGTITFDGNGKTMLYTGTDYAICGANTAKDTGYIAAAPAEMDTLTVKNLNLVGKKSGTSGSAGGFKFYNSILHLAEGNVMTTENVVVLTPRSHGKVIVSGGVYNAGIGVGSDKTSGGKSFPSTCDIEITGGIFNASVTMSGSATNKTENTAVISGGIFNGKLTLNNCTATVTGGMSTSGATVSGLPAGAAFTQNAVAGIGGQGYADLDSALTAAAAATADVTVKVLADGTSTKTFNPKHAYNVTIEGVAKNGVNPKITTTVGSNKFRLEGGANYTFKNVDILNEKQNGCLFQVNKSTGGNLDIIGCNITSADQYSVINLMASGGQDQKVNIIDSTITQTASKDANHAIIMGGNAGGHFMNMLVNIENSTLTGCNYVVNVSDGSTAQIDIKGSTLTSTSKDVIVVADPAKGKIVKTTACSADGYSELNPATGFLKVKTVTTAGVTVNVKEKTLAMIGDVEYTTYDAAFAAAAAAKEDVTVKLVADGAVSAMVEFKGTANVTIDGDPDGDGVCAKLTTTHGANNFRWYTADKTLTFKNIDMTVNAANGCVFQLGYNGASTLVLDNVDVKATAKWHVINVMANDGKTTTVTINNSNIETTSGNMISTGNNNDHAHNLDLNVTGSTLKTPGIVVICNNPSTVDLDVIDSDLTSTGGDAISVAGTGEGSSVYVDDASTITVPEGKKMVNATAPKTDVITPWDIVMTVSTVEGETKTLILEIMRKDVGKYGESNMIGAAETLAGKNVVVDILMPFEAKGQIAFRAQKAGTTITINGNNHLITTKQNDGGRNWGFFGNDKNYSDSGKIIVNNLNFKNLDQSSSIAQIYRGVTVDLVDCTLDGSSKHQGFWLTNQSNLNVLGTTTISAGGHPVRCSGGMVENVFIDTNAKLVAEGDAAALLVNGNAAHTIVIKGTLVGKNALDCSVASANITISGTVDGPIKLTAGTVNIGAAANFARSGAANEGVVNGDITVAGGTLNVIGGTINGSTTVSAGTVSVAEGTITGSVEVTGGDVTVSGGTVAGNVTVSGGAITVKDEAALTGNITVSEGNVSLENATLAGDVTATGGKVTVSDSSISGDVSADKGTFEVESGVISGTNGAYEVVDGIVFDGAAIRLRNDYTNGLRFVNTISKALVDKINAAKDADTAVEYGTIVFPKKYIDEAGLTVVTHAALIDAGYTADKIVDIVASNGLTMDEAGNVVLSAAIIEIKGSHYDWEFVSIAYAKYVKDGQTVYAYSNVNADELAANAKSVKSVSEAALADTQEEAGGDYRFPYNGAYTKYSPSKIAVLEGFAGLREMPEAPSKPVNPDRPEVHSHKYTEVVTAPTCFEPGYTTYSCTCGNTYTGAETDPAHDAITHVAALAATCLENGNIEYWFCETCGSAWLDEACMLNTNLKAVVLPSAGGHTDVDYNGKCDTCNKYFLPEAGEAFKLQLVQANLGKTLYFTGKMSGYYYATGDYNAAVDVYIEDAEGGFNMYFLNGETKNYLYVVASGSHINVKYGTTNGGNVWTFNEELGSLETVVNGTDYYIGTYNTYNTISASKTSFVNSGNVDKSQFVARAVSFADHEHSYSEATCTKLATCACGATTGELADHSYGEGVPTAPTCTAAGYTTYTCGACSGTKKVDGDAALGHTTENGTCDRCGEAIGGDVSGEPVTASKTMKELIVSEGWNDSTTKQTFKLDENVTVKINGGNNTGKAYNGDHIRIYASDSPAGTITITVPDGYELVSVKITTVTGTYAFLYVSGSTTDICNKTTEVSGSSVVLNSVMNGTSGKQVRVTAIEVVYQAV